MRKHAAWMHVQSHVIAVCVASGTMSQMVVSHAMDACDRMNSSHLRARASESRWWLMQFNSLSILENRAMVWLYCSTISDSFANNNRSTRRWWADSVAEQDDVIMIGLSCWVELFIALVGLRSETINFLFILFSLNHVQQSKSNTPHPQSNNGRTRVEHGDAFRDHRRSPIRDHDIFVASVPHGGRKSQYLHRRRGAHLHDRLRSRTAGSRQPSALGWKRCNPEMKSYPLFF